MALGKPVVATDAGGPREIVVHGQTGFLAAPHSPEALAEAISGVIAQPEARVRLGNEGRKRFAENFTAVQMAERTLEVYREAFARSRKSRMATGGRNANDVRTAGVH
jgi:glycosyltransferase involved in cell wall biosynthesis